MRRGWNTASYRLHQSTNICRNNMNTYEHLQTKRNQTIHSRTTSADLLNEILDCDGFCLLREHTIRFTHFTPSHLRWTADPPNQSISAVSTLESAWEVPACSHRTQVSFKGIGSFQRSAGRNHVE